MLARVADSLYWMSRYLERAEHTARLLDVHLNLVPDISQPESAQRRARLLQSLWVTPPGESPVQSDYQLFDFITFDHTNSHSILACIAAARENIRQVREQVSTEMWQQINELYIFVRNSHMDEIWNDRPSAFLHTIKQGSHLFQGITDSTLSHGQGWHFIQVGRYIERVVRIVSLLRVETQALDLAGDAQAVSSQYAHWLGLLKCCTAFEAYSKVYTAHVEPYRVLEFLTLNAEFPHSICFGVQGIQSALDAIADSTETHRGARVYRLAGRLRALLDYGHIDEIIADDLEAYLSDIELQCSRLHGALYQMYITYPIEEKLAA
jgi:uncharacterized alpha-E superfamily protein